jgi:hypothetical protein
MRLDETCDILHLIDVPYTNRDSDQCFFGGPEQKENPIAHEPWYRDNDN